MAAQRHLARPTIEIRGKRLAKERLCRRNAAVTAKAKVDSLSLLVDRSIQVMPFASNGNVRLVGAPGSSDGSRESVPALLIFRHVPGDPSQDGAVGYHDTALRHHCSQVAIAQPVGDVPANAQLDDFSVEHSSAVNGITGDRLGHSEPLSCSPNLTGKSADAEGRAARADRPSSTAPFRSASRRSGVTSPLLATVMLDRAPARAHNR